MRRVSGNTQKEYDYAVLQRKPVIPLLHENADNLSRERTEADAEGPVAFLQKRDPQWKLSKNADFPEDQFKA
jgi:hypothetical protein